MKYIINGGKKLEGSVRISGSKNAVLPVLATTAITKKRSIIHNCPRLSDVASTIRILQFLGCRVCYDKGTLAVDSSESEIKEVPQSLMSALRSSVIFLGSFTAERGTGSIRYPGGCELGKRPIDIHIDILRQMGAKLTENDGCLNFDAKNIRGGEYVLPFPSVGATENIILASLAADDDVVIKNAAKEPEIIELADFLNCAGAVVEGAGSEKIVVRKEKCFRDCEYTVRPDRIECATYMAAAAVTGSTISIENAPCADMRSTLNAFEQAGCEILERGNGVTFISPQKLKAADMISTAPYPGFPTDAQPVVTSALLNARGTSMIVENIFEKRFNHINELRKLGANINVFGNTLKITGSLENMHGGTVQAMDLRAGASLIVAGLGIKGRVIVEDTHHIIRGYEGITEKFRALGADMEEVKNE